MLGKTEFKINKPRDGRHCDLCGCSFPAVRCDKCNSQIFCLSCDDMYHRHPKRRFHLRKAVDPTPTPQARPVLPMKVSNLPLAPGDPSKMPLPPPRKKKPGKSFLDTFRRGSPSDNSPPLPKKEYSWTDRLGSIKKFMSNRPLPPVPNNVQENFNSTPTTKNDLSFIHMRVDDKPPQLPQRQPKPQTHQSFHEQNNNESGMNARNSTPIDDFGQRSPSPRFQCENGEIFKDSSNMPNGNMSQFVRSRGQSFDERNQWPMDTSQNMNQHAFQHMMNPNAAFGNPADIQGFGTLRRQTHSPVMVSNEKQGGMHQSASATDLHSLTNAIPLQGMPQYPPYPMNPQVAPHYPYPMYPPYPNYPQYFGNSWANLSSQPPTTDGDFSDQSEASSGRFMGKRHPFHKDRKAKRSQSVMFDRMAYPGQYYPYGPYPPGYGPQPWMPPHPVEAPPSPAGSIRSLNRAGRTRRRRKTVDDDDDFSISSSPLSRPKSSSSERPEAADRRVSTRRRKSNKSSSSDEDYAEDEDSSHPKHTEQLPAEKNNLKQQSYKRRGSSPRQPSPALKSLLDQKKHFSDNKKQRNEMPVSSKTLQHDQSIDNSNSDALDKHARTQNLDIEEKVDYHSSDEEAKQSKAAPWIPSDKWQCKFCTFINAAGERICQVCCKTAVKSTSPIRHTSIENIARKGSVSSRKSTESPEIRPQSVANESSQSGTEKRDMALLNSALDEAEKEINRGLEELLKINDETPAHQPTVNTTDVTQNNSSNVSSHTNNGKSDDTNVKLKPVTITPSGNQNAPDKNHTVNENDVADKQQKTNMSSIATSETQTSSDNIDSASNIKTTRSSSVSSALSDSSVSASSYNQKNAISYKVSEKASSPLFSRVGKQRIVPASLKESIAESQLRKDSSCQTQQDTILEFLKRKKAEEIALSNVANQRSMNGGYQYPYGRHDVMSPTPQNIFSSPNERGLVGGYGMMHRSHSRASLFGGRLSDAAPATHEYGGLGFGLGPSNMYRSLSRPSLTCDSSDSWVSEFPGLHKPEYYLSMEELVERRRQETMRAQGLELVRMIREAEQQGFTADDIQVALNNCGKQNPVVWLQDNWKGLIDTVVTLSTNYGIDKKENDIGVVCENEARDSLRLHKGNIWASVTECVEGRQRKFLELGARGNFTCKEIIEALTSSEGNVEMAYAKLTKTSLKPFLMRIWGTGEGAQNQEGALPRSPSPVSFQDELALHSDKKEDIENTRYEEFSDQETWEDDEYEEEEVAWEEEPDEEVEEENLNDMNNFVVQSAREICVSNNANSLKRNIHKLQTPESDPSDYCDAFGAGLDDHNLSSSIDEIYLVGFDDENDFDSTKKSETKRKGTSFLSKLAALRKEMKSPEGKNEDINKETSIPHNNDLNEAPVFQKTDELPADDSKNSPETSEQTKNFSPFSILKQTFSAIKDSVTGASTKSDKSSARSISDRRTIVVHGRVAHESLPLDSSDEVANLTSFKILPPDDDDELLPLSDENNSISITEIQKVQTANTGDISIENKETDIVFDHMPTIISSKDSDIKLSINEETVSVNNTVDETNFPDKSSSLKSDALNNEIRKKQSIKIETMEDINEKSHSNFYLDTKPNNKIDTPPVDIPDNCNEVIHKSIDPDSVSDTSKIFNKALELNVAASSSKETLSIVKDIEKVDADESLGNKKEVISESDFASQKSSAKVAFVENLFVPQNEIHAKIFLPEAISTPNLNLVTAVSKDETLIINNQKKNSENSLIDRQYSNVSGDHEKITLPDEGVKTFTEVNAKTSFSEQTLLQETIQSELEENVSIKENDTSGLAHSIHSGNIETLNENFKYTGAKDLTPKNTNSGDEVSLNVSVIKSNSLLHTPSLAATNVHLNSESIAQEIIKTTTVELKAKNNLPEQMEAGKIVENKHNVGFEFSSTSSKNDSKKEVEKNNIADIPAIAEKEKNKLLDANVVSNQEESRPAGAFAESRDIFHVRINTNSNANTSFEDTKKHLQSAEDNVNASSLGDSDLKPSDAYVSQSVPKKKLKKKKN